MKHHTTNEIDRMKMILTGLCQGFVMPLYIEHAILFFCSESKLYGKVSTIKASMVICLELYLPWLQYSISLPCFFALIVCPLATFQSTETISVISTVYFSIKEHTKLFLVPESIIKVTWQSFSVFKTIEKAMKDILSVSDSSSTTFACSYDDFSSCVLVYS